VFEKALKAKLLTIFGLAKASFESPSEAKEQECIFIKVDSNVSSVKQGLIKGRAKGSFAIFANSEKIPFGFLQKKINSAKPSDTVDIFFYNIDQNEKYFGNLVERSCGFVYFYSQQYDPDAGEMTSVNLSIDEA
jgi:hypothetical protein